ncbi:MAG: hypothetical protein ACRC1K_23765 [Planctomycetia bacterium]
MQNTHAAATATVNRLPPPTPTVPDYDLSTATTPFLAHRAEMVAEAERFLRLACPSKGTVFEARLISAKSYRYKEIQTGVYDGDHIPAAARAVVNKSLDPAVPMQGAYFTINDVKRDCLARANNRLIKADKGGTTSDAEIDARRLILIDVDPKRPVPDVSATDAEVAAAREVADGVVAYLTAKNWPEPLVVFSGNGWHVYYRIDAPNDAASASLVERFLKSLAAKFDTTAATIDTKVFNASRISRIAGTVTRKGDHAPEIGRPHRVAYILSNPATLAVVDPLLVQAEAADAPEEKPSVHPPAAQVSKGEPRLADRYEPTVWTETDKAAAARRYYGGFNSYAVAGENGSGATIRAAAVGLGGFDLPAAVVYDLLQKEYNPHCEPPWDDADLWRKVEEAERKFVTVRGEKLAGKRPPGSKKRRGRKPKAVQAVPVGYQGLAADDPVLMAEAAVANQERRETTDDLAAWIGGVSPQAAVAVASVPAVEQSIADERPTVVIDQWESTVDAAMRQTTAVLADSRTFFCSAGQLRQVFTGECRPILSAPQFAGAFSMVGEVVYKTSSSESHLPYPTRYADTWLNNPQQIQRLPVLDLFTKTPVFDADFNVVQPGYNPTSKVYYKGEVIPPAERLDLLPTLLKEFCWRDPAADRSNYVGFLLGAFVAHHFPGTHPGAVFNGNQKGVGKSILMQCVAALRDDKLPLSLTYNPNDEEFEKGIGSLVRGGATVINVDNAKPSRFGHEPVIESACLERSLTDPVLSYRLLGESSRIVTPNTILFGVTANHTRLSPDLVPRFVPINLYYEGNTNNRRFTINSPVRWVLQNRQAILSEIVFMYEQWKSAGRPSADIDFRTREWAELIGGILQSNGFDGFLSNVNESADDFDPERRDMAELAEAAWNDGGGFEYAVNALVRLCDADRIFRRKLGDPEKSSTRSRESLLGKAIQRFINETFEVTDGRSGSVVTVTLTKRLHNRTRSFVYSFEQASLQPAEPVDPDRF